MVFLKTNKNQGETLPNKRTYSKHFTESQNMMSWKGHTMIIKSNS